MGGERRPARGLSSPLASFGAPQLVDYQSASVASMPDKEKGCDPLTKRRNKRSSRRGQTLKGNVTTKQIAWRTYRWTVLMAATAFFTAIVAVVAWLRPASRDEVMSGSPTGLEAKAAHPLTLVDFSIKETGEVTIVEEDMFGAKYEDTRQSTIMDVTLLNPSAVSAVLTRAEVRVRRAVTFPTCLGEGGELTASGRYDIKLPPPVGGRPPHPQVVSVTLHQEVPGGRPDRFEMSLGTAGDVYNPDLTLYELEIYLHHSGDNEPLSLGQAVVVDKLTDFDRYFSSAAEERPGCAEANRALLKTAFGFPGKRSDEVARMVAYL